MRAARYYGQEDVRVEDNVPEPQLKPGQVKIKPAFVGICGTDLHEYLGGPNFCPVNAHPVTGETIPITLGHEFSGTITEISPDVTGFQVGQLCAIQPTICCNKCSACKAGAPNVCSSGGFVGLSGGGGGLSDAVCVNATHVLPLPDGVSLDIGALVEPLAVAWHATTAAPKMGPETSVLVIGGGPIGLAMILCLKAQGVKNIFVSEVASSRQKFAKAFGAVRVIDPSKEDARAIVLDATAQKGVEVAFDCAGVPASIKTACQSVGTKGTVVNIAIWEREIPFNPNWVTWNESTFKSVLGYNRVDFESVIKHIGQGTIKPAEMITAKIKLDNIVKDGIQSLIKDKDNHVKILVDMAA